MGESMAEVSYEVVVVVSVSVSVSVSVGAVVIIIVDFGVDGYFAVVVDYILLFLVSLRLFYLFFVINVFIIVVVAIIGI